MTELRPDWDDYYIGIAKAVSARADCTRRKVGVIIVDQNYRPLGQGYNGAPPRQPGCLSTGSCPRGQMSLVDILPGSSYDTGAGSCIAVHAEVNAILDAGGRRACLGATLYITSKPCDGCARIIEAAGIVRVIYPTNSIAG